MTSKTKRNYFALRFLLLCLVTGALFSATVTNSQSGCPSANNNGWAQCMNVYYTISSSITGNSSEAAQIRSALTKWTTANSTNNSRVQFIEGSAPAGATNYGTLTIGNGMIDNAMELFGTATPQPGPERNGFLALAEYDKPTKGGNGDGIISHHDAIFSSLRLWIDANHNGISESSELLTLDSFDIKKLELDYREARRVDRSGNQFKWRAKVRDNHNAQVGRWAWDVIPVHAQ